MAVRPNGVRDAAITGNVIGHSNITRDEGSARDYAEPSSRAS